MNQIDQILKILEAHESRLDTVDRELDGNHVEWQRDRGRYIRLESQVEALVSILGELASRSGICEERVATCFRERFLIFQDKRLRETEAASPDLAAHIDTRGAGEIPTNQEFHRLFPE